MPNRPPKPFPLLLSFLFYAPGQLGVHTCVTDRTWARVCGPHWPRSDPVAYPIFPRRSRKNTLQIVGHAETSCTDLRIRRQLRAVQPTLFKVGARGPPELTKRTARGLRAFPAVAFSLFFASFCCCCCCCSSSSWNMCVAARSLRRLFAVKLSHDSSDLIISCISTFMRMFIWGIVFCFYSFLCYVLLI